MRDYKSGNLSCESSPDQETSLDEQDDQLRQIWFAVWKNINGSKSLKRDKHWFQGRHSMKSVPSYGTRCKVKWSKLLKKAMHILMDAESNVPAGWHSCSHDSIASWEEAKLTTWISCQVWLQATRGWVSDDQKMTQFHSNHRMKLCFCTVIHEVWSWTTHTEAFLV